MWVGFAVDLMRDGFPVRLAFHALRDDPEAEDQHDGEEGGEKGDSRGAGVFVLWDAARGPAVRRRHFSLLFRGF